MSKDQDMSQDLEKPDQTEHETVADRESKARRRLLQTLAVGGVAGAARVLPEQWVKPVVDVVTLPAHAQATGLAVGGGGGSTAPAGPASQSMTDKVLDFFVEKAEAAPACAIDAPSDVCVEISDNGSVATLVKLCVSCFKDGSPPYKLIGSGAPKTGAGPSYNWNVGGFSVTYNRVNLAANAFGTASVNSSGTFNVTKGVTCSCVSVCETGCVSS
jgi:hypothetical protein